MKKLIRLIQWMRLAHWKVPVSALILFPGFLLLQNCGLFEQGESPPDVLSIVSWNVQALFDGEDNGTEYNEYKAEAGWNEEKYRARLNLISGAIKQINAGGDQTAEKSGVPDITALIEVESSKVLEELAAMPDMPYGWHFFANTGGASLGLGVLSRFPIVNARAHSISVSGAEAPRPVSEVRIEPPGREALVLMICHWKSKLGGEKATEPLRQAEAAVILRRLEEIEADSPHTPVIILGDLNENHDEFIRIGGAFTCALIEDCPEAAEYPPALNSAGGSRTPRPGFRNFLILSGGKPPGTEYLPPEFRRGVLFSPWMDQDFEGETITGSYYYRENWETIDHFLLNPVLFGRDGWEYAGFSVLGTAPFTGAGNKPHVGEAAAYFFTQSNPYYLERSPFGGIG
jgi:hypothetical protein